MADLDGLGRLGRCGRVGIDVDLGGLSGIGRRRSRLLVRLDRRVVPALLDLGRRLGLLGLHRVELFLDAVRVRRVLRNASIWARPILFDTFTAAACEFREL